MTEFVKIEQYFMQLRYNVGSLRFGPFCSTYIVSQQEVDIML